MSSNSKYPILDDKPIDKWKVTELKEELKRRKLATKGLKEDLINRLDEALREEREAAEAARKKEQEAAEASPEQEAAEGSKKDEVNGLDTQVDEVKDSKTINVDAGTIQASEQGNSGVVEPFETDNVAKVPEVLDNDGIKNVDQDGVTDPVDANNSVSAMDLEGEHVESANAGEEAVAHPSNVETTVTVTETVVTETVSTEVVVGGQDSCSSEKNNEDSAIKLGNEESKAQLDSEDSKPQLESDTKPPCDDLMPNSSAPENQVSEVNPSLGTQVKSDSFSTDSVSINQKNELKDTIIANNVKLEQDNVRPEMVEEPSSRNDVPVYDESHSVDVGGLHEKKPSGEENNNNVTSPELNKTNSSDDVGYPEKVNLDRSSGDDSMEEDLPEIRQYDSKFNDELSDKVENNEVLMGKEQSKPIVVGDGVSARNSYGSQTGTAEDFSHKLNNEAKKYGFDPEVVDCEEFEWSDLAEEKFAMFVMATYGEGEPTDNARNLDEWLNDTSLDETTLSNVKFTVFGLGNKTYEHYNAVARKVDKRIEELGGQRIFKRGEGDDDASLEDDFSAWRKELWPALCEHFGLQLPSDVNSDLERRFRITFFNKDSNEAKLADKNSKLHLVKKSSGPRVDGSYDIKNPYLGKIVVNKELHTEESDRSCRHVEIEVGTAVKYEAGDHLGVYPENNQQVVIETAKRLGVELDAIFAMYPADKVTSRPFLGPTTVRQALTQWVDLTDPPRKSVIKVLAHYASDPSEKEKLLELSDDTKQNPYATYVKEEHRTILCLLNEHPSINIPFDHFFEILPRLNARYYSISSSLKEHPGKVHVTSVVVEFTTKADRKHLGVCSNWLARQIPQDQPIHVPVFIEKANFRLPKDPKVPIIMIGPGTGLAPFRGFIQERKHQLSQGPIGETVLFFGCRSSRFDYIYKDELSDAVEKGYITNLFVAFSREGHEKVYVQHKIQEYAKELWYLLSEKAAVVYVCGDARNMAKDVRTALKNTAIEFGNYTEEDAEKWMTDIQKQGRYMTDVWF